LEEYHRICETKVGIIGHEFTICWQGRDELLSVTRAQKALLKWGYAVEDVHLAAWLFPLGCERVRLCMI
jgi:hypothetical protein